MTPLVLPAGSVVVVAPHPDDETLGCGGLIARCAEDEIPLHVVFVTDGSASHPRSPIWSHERLAKCREAEAEEALRRFGVGAAPRTFLRLPDAAMPLPGSDAHRQAVATVFGLFRALSPELVVLPWRRDPHCDHRGSWTLAMAALEGQRFRLKRIEYAIWLDELGAPEDLPRAGEAEKVALAVSSARERHAVEAHRSQLGLVVPDDPGGFTLQPATVARLTGLQEVYWRPCAAT